MPSKKNITENEIILWKHMHMNISLNGFVAGRPDSAKGTPSGLSGGEMNWIKVDEGIFDHVGKLISKGDTALYGRVTRCWKVTGPILVV